ncbi:MAG: alcohol dehydrogenase catalytic domain-containing protein, partial [Acidobacteriota bacterium]|nr:alcohol dehydrogenase catalytic domain-containing protein [Acidobacteriota bacterium]
MRVAAAGICGTDPHILSGMYPASLPLIPGHEYAGVVEAVGDGVEGFAPGDPIAVD